MAPSPASPTAPRERDLVVDALRGFALFGILVMNRPTWSYAVPWGLRHEQYWTAPWDVFALNVSRYLFAGKFNALYSMLFGIGFALQMEKLAERGGSTVYLRRLAVLAGFGLLHAIFIWHGDVLLIYAQLGLVLLLCRRLSSRTLLALAALALVASPLAQLVQTNWLESSWMARNAQWKAHYQQFSEIATSGTYLQHVRSRLDGLALRYSTPWSFIDNLSLLGTMLLGFVTGRHRLWRAAAARKKTFATVLVSCLVIAVLANIGIHLLRPHYVWGKPSFVNVAISALFELQRPAMLMVYAIGFVLIAGTKVAQPVVRLIGAAGRMPLTNYIAQSLIGTWLCYAYGLGLFGKVGPALGYLYCVVFYLLQLLVSRWYLARHAYGPLEAVWRSLTYGRRSSSDASRVLVARS